MGWGFVGVGGKGVGRCVCVCVWVCVRARARVFVLACVGALGGGAHEKEDEGGEEAGDGAEVVVGPVLPAPRPPRRPAPRTLRSQGLTALTAFFAVKGSSPRSSTHPPPSCPPKRFTRASDEHNAGWVIFPDYLVQIICNP